MNANWTPLRLIAVTSLFAGMAGLMGGLLILGLNEWLRCNDVCTQETINDASLAIASCLGTVMIGRWFRRPAQPPARKVVRTRKQKMIGAGR